MYSVSIMYRNMYSKTCVKRPLSKRLQIGFQDQLLLNAGQKYCRMLQGEHSAILSFFIKLPHIIKIFVVFLVAVLHRFYCIHLFKSTLLIIFILDTCKQVLCKQ